MTMRSNTIFVVLLLASSFVTPLSTLADDISPSENLTFKIYGSVFNFNGEIVDSTSIKVDFFDSIWSVNGMYEFNGIILGEYVI
jgi:hypothetical protein